MTLKSSLTFVLSIMQKILINIVHVTVELISSISTHICFSVTQIEHWPAKASDKGVGLLIYFLYFSIHELY